MNPKRKRGGQKGNQNARKHGFYSLYMSRPELLELQKTLEPGDVPRDVVILRIKLSSALRSAPGNRRVLADASRSLSRIYRSGYSLDKTEYTEYKKFIRIVIKEAAARYSKTNEAESGNNAKILPNELKLNLKNPGKNYKTNQSRKIKTNTPFSYELFK